jgi:hypothetical protein
MNLAAIFGFLLVGCLVGSAEAQAVVQPATVYYPPAVTVYSPPAVPTVPAMTCYRPPTTVYTPPVPVHTPAVTTVARPVVTYSPAVTYPPVPPAVVPVQPVVVGRGILGGPEAYVPGQPIRNALRFVLP